MAHRGTCYGAPTVDMDMQLAKNWMIKEKVRVKFAMDFFDLFNHPNFNSSALEGTGYAPANIACGGKYANNTAVPCSATNPQRVITDQSAVTGWGSVTALQVGRGNRELQYSLKLSF